MPLKRGQILHDIPNKNAATQTLLKLAFMLTKDIHYLALGRAMGVYCEDFRWKSVWAWNSMVLQHTFDLQYIENPLDRKRSHHVPIVPGWFIYTHIYTCIFSWYAHMYEILSLTISRATTKVAYRNNCWDKRNFIKWNKSNQQKYMTTMLPPSSTSYFITVYISKARFKLTWIPK